MLWQRVLRLHVLTVEDVWRSVQAELFHPDLQTFQREKMRHLLLHGMDWNVWNVVPAVMSVRRNVS